MHVVHILPELKQGGVEQVVLDLNREMVREGLTSTVISAGGPLADTIRNDGGQHLPMDVCSKNPISIPARVSLLRNMLRTLSPDVLHLHSRVPAWLAYFANRPLHIPAVTTVHGFNSVSKYSEIMTRGDRVICVSHPIKAYIQQYYRVPDERIRVIHPGIHPEAFDPEKVDPAAVSALKERFNLHGCVVVSAIGRITGLKDYETFIRAISQTANSNPHVRGLIVGHVRADKQAYYESLKSLIAALNMESIVHIATDLTDMAAVYSASDWVVSCSKKPESFGLTLVEALAMNTPVIATRHGGPLDIIREGENGFLFEPQRPEELALILCNKPRLRCVDLRTDTLERFSIARMADATMETYQNTQ
jgi:glycosyltransferase involved in cell wall biosynthesis